ncbi:hypothetical protein [Arsenicicoccus sp. oral taxon 190]|uniref:hypothetical protein n=1 Tax=Arsenicicoccus sp. oral taxon 190 TaxID=1658671 RepID=UPI0012E10890|nr:hypothetical protein [Arsenicicoccus sp. oral taxon 190]
MSWLRLVRPAVARTRALTLLLAVVVLVTTTLVTALPALTDTASAAWLADRWSSAPPTGRALLVQSGKGVSLTAPGQVPAGDPYAPTRDAVQGALRPATELFQPVVTAAYAVDPVPITPSPQGTERMGIPVLSPALGPRVRWVQGRAPAPSTREETRTITSLDETGNAVESSATVPVLEVALSRRAATQWQVRVGDRWRLPAAAGLTTQIPMVISGIYEPLDPADPFWQWFGELTDVVRVAGSDPNAGVKPTVAVALCPQDYATVMVTEMANGLGHTWIWQVDPARATPERMPQLTQGLARLARQPDLGITGAAQVRSSIPDTLSAWQGGVRTTRVLDGTVTTGLTVLVAALALLLAGLRAERRAADDTLLRSRGAAVGQLAALAALDVLPPVVLAGAAGHAAACLLAGRWLAPWPAVVLVTLTAAVAAVTAVRAAGRDVPGRRTRLRAGLDLTGRFLPPLALVGITALAVVTVRQRPAETPTASSGSLTRASTGALVAGDQPDLLLQATPALVAVCAGMLLLLLVRWGAGAAARAATRRAGAGGWLGLVHTARASGSARLPLVAITVAGAVAVLTSTVGSTLATTRTLETWRQVGADVALTSDRIDPGVVDAVAAAPGVEAVAPLGERTGELVSDRTGATSRAPVTVLVGSSEQVAQVRAGSPVALDPAAARAAGEPGLTLVTSADLPVLHQPGLTLVVERRRLPVTQVVVDPALRATGSTTRVLVPRPVLERALDTVVPPTTLLVRTAPTGTTSVAGVRAATGSARLPVQLTDRRALESQSAAGPLARHVATVVTLTWLAAAVLAALGAHALTTATAASRRQLLARARVLGMAGGARRTTVLVAVLPAALAAVLAGLLVGLGLPALLPRLLDLAPVAGGGPYPPLQPSWPAVLAVAAALSALVVGAALLDLRATARLSLTRHLRAGDHP